MKRLMCLLALLALPVLATPVAIIDFRSAEFSPANGLSSFSLLTQGILVDISANQGTLYWDATDGLGINSTSYEDDEIEGPERLRVTLTSPPTLIWKKVHLTDLFHENGYLETGAISFDLGANWQWFQADPGQTPGGTNGELTLEVDQVAPTVLFRAPGLVACTNQEFSVAGIEVQSTPEPHAAALAFIGLALLVVRGLRRKLPRRG